MFKFPKKNKGFTLVEALVYIAVSSVLLLVITSLGFNIFTNRQRVLAQEEIIENANLVLGKITSAIHNAQSIILPLTAGNGLSLEMLGVTLNPTNFYLEGSTLFLKQGTSGGIALTTDKVIVTGLEFTKITNNETGLSLKINLSLSSPKGDVNSSFETTVVLR